MSRLSRHDKQAVRRFIRSQARSKPSAVDPERTRAHRGDWGSEVGTRHLIQDANHKMRLGDAATSIFYPQDHGCGMVDVAQAIRAGRALTGGEA